jgi:hypothetical protein
MKRKPLIYALVILATLFAWAAFRPERLFVNAKVNESLPTMNSGNTSGGVLESGKFHSVAHESSGEANIYELADGKRILRFTNFTTSNGPDIHVYLVAANDATDSDTVKKSGFREIGSLKGNIGDQNYELPADIDLAKYRAVTIWCQRFGVNFGTAPLSTQQASNGMAQVLASGTFHSVAHQSAGQATILQLPEGKRILRFTNFQTSNGPDVRVYLVATTDASDSDTVKRAGFVELSALKGNIGDQNYEMPSDLDLNKYRAVTIWCKRFSVNFATAPLSASAAPMTAMKQ